MAKWTCSSCGYVYNGFKPLERCPVCKASTFKKNEERVKSTAAYVTNNKSYTKQEVEINQTPKNTVGNTQSNRPIMQGVSVVAINVVSEQDIAGMVQREVNKEITKLNAQGKRVIDITTSISAKNIVGMKLHAVLLWESDK